MRRTRLSGMMAVLALGSCLWRTASTEAATYVVDQKDPTATQANPGTAEKPLRTISEAIPKLKPGDTLLIKAGLYRESVTLERSGTAEQPITIAAAPGDEGQVIITGSDAVTGWKQEVGLLWSVPWTQTFEAKYPADWADWGEYPRRCEMVFVRGKPLEQVLAQGLIRRGTFCVNEKKGRLFIALREYGGPGPVEVTARQRGLYVHASHLRLSGLAVTHVANPYPEGAFHVWGNDIEIRGCRIEWNNLDGLRLSAGDCRVFDCVASNNGKCGIAASIRNCLLQGNTTNGNSWRFGPEWEAGGVKIVGGAPSNNRVFAHTARDNLGRGIWFDYGCKMNRVEQCVLDHNLISGIELEACLAENWIVNNVITRTRIYRDALDEHGTGAGILLYESAGTHVYNNTVVANERCGLLLAGGMRKIHYDGSVAKTVDTRIMNNLFAANGQAAIQFWLWEGGGGPEPLATHRSDHNLFFPAQDGVVAILQGGKRAATLADWQKALGQDAHSIEADPRFVKPDGSDYHLSADSPAARAGVALPGVRYDVTSRPRPPDQPCSLGAYEVAPPAKP